MSRVSPVYFIRELPHGNSLFLFYSQIFKIFITLANIMALWVDVMLLKLL